eukprot:3217409-Pyramimonas_sp.AAC.1
MRARCLGRAAVQHLVDGQSQLFPEHSPHGHEQATAEARKKTEVGNACVRQLQKIIRACLLRGLPVGCENPAATLMWKEL